MENKWYTFLSSKRKLADDGFVNNELFISNELFEKFSKNGVPQPNDIMITAVGTLGKCYIVKEEDKFYYKDASVICLENRFELNADYLVNYINSNTMKEQIKNNSSGTTVETLTMVRMNEYYIPIPPINEQMKIVEKIQKLFPYIAKFNEKYEKLELLNSSYKEELKKSILQYAIQGKLIPQNPNDESADILINKILEEKRELIKIKQIKKENLSVIYEDDTDNQFYEKFDDGTIVNITDEIPFEIPDNWCWTRMKNICLINPKNSLDDNLETSFIPMTLIDAGYSNSHTYEIKKWKEIKSGFTHFKENDIGLAKITPCFQNRKSTIFSNLKNGFGAGTTELHILRPINDLIYTKFIFWLIKSPYFIDNGVKTYSGTAGQQRINKDFLPNFLVPIPNYKTQVCIINKIETIFNLI